MDDGMIHIPARRKPTTAKSQPVKLSAEAYNALVEVYNESCWSMSAIASAIILQSIDRISYDKEEE